MDPDDFLKIPESARIIFEDTTYSIYFSTGTLMCFECQEEGHLARNCQKQKQIDNSTRNLDTLNDESEIFETLNISQVNDNDTMIISTHTSELENKSINDLIQTETIKEKFKRPLSLTS